MITQISTSYQNFKTYAGCKVKEVYLRIRLKTPVVANRIRIGSGVLAGYCATLSSSGASWEWHSINLTTLGAILGIIGTIAASLAVESKEDLHNAMKGPDITPPVPPSKTDNI